jgi:hypothetical protein
MQGDIATLSFEEAGTVSVTVEVKGMASAGPGQADNQPE